MSANQVAQLTGLMSMFQQLQNPQPTQPAPVYVQPAPAPVVGGPVEELPEIPEIQPITVNTDVSELDDAIREAEQAERVARNYVMQAPSGENYGGLFDGVGNMIGRFRDDLIGTTGAATRTGLNATKRTVSRVLDQVAAIARQSNQNHSNIRSQGASIRQTSRRIAKIEQAWEERFGEQGRMYRAALATLSALPGIRSLDVLQGDAFRGVVKGFSDMADQAGKLPDFDAPSLSYAKTISAAYDKAEVDAALDEIRTQHKALVATYNAQITAMRNALVALTEAEVEKHADALTVSTTGDTFDTLSKISPDQYYDRTQAMMTGAAKLVLGKAPGSTGGLLGNLI